MSMYIIPFFIIFVVLYAIRHKTNVYKSFVDGSKKSLYLVFEIFAYLLAIFVIIELFRVTGISQYLSNLLKPFFAFFGIPNELCELVLLRPFSGSGSMAVLTEIYTKYGADSYVSRVASVIVSSTDTVFYVSTVFFSKTKIKKLSYAIPIALFTMFLSVILACIVCKIL